MKKIIYEDMLFKNHGEDTRMEFNSILVVTVVNVKGPFFFFKPLNKENHVVFYIILYS